MVALPLYTPRHTAAHEPRSSTSNSTALVRDVPVGDARVVWGTGSKTYVEPFVGTSTAARPVARVDTPSTPSEIVARVRGVLSLNVSELARVLGVERPTVYAWMSQEAWPQPENWARLLDLSAIAGLWEVWAVEPLGARVRTPTEHGPSVAALLEMDPLPVVELARALQVWAQGPTLGKGLRSRGLNAFETGPGLAEIDRVTGRPLAPED